MTAAADNLLDLGQMLQTQTAGLAHDPNAALIPEMTHIAGTGVLFEQTKAFATGDSIVQKPFKGEGIVPNALQEGAGESYNKAATAQREESARQESAAKAEQVRAEHYKAEQARQDSFREGGVSIFGQY
jgi:hypothetical protein